MTRGVCTTGFVLKPQGFAVVGFAYGFAGFAYGLEVSQSRETSTAAAAAVQVSAADSHTFAEKQPAIRKLTGLSEDHRTLAVLQPGFLPACPSPSVLINSLGVVN